MDIANNVLLFCIGLAFSLFGMQLMSSNLEQLSGGILERTLEKATKNRFMAVILGAVVTAVVQSSSATTVMVVGFVNSGIMKLSQVVGIIMGANIGTTITSWLLSLTGIEAGSSVLLWLMKPSTFSPVMAIIGIILLLFSKKEKSKTVGTILLSFALLMFGMSTMGDAVEPLAESETFAELLLLFRNPVFGVIVGAVFTGIIQSSAATVAILIALAAAVSGSDAPITYGVALPIVLGSNIGTCVTALISCIGANRNACRAAMVHLYFNTIGTIVFLCLFYTADAFFDFAFIDEGVSEFGIAIIHTVFNVLATIMFFPMPNVLCRLAELTVPDKKGVKKEGLSPIDERFLATPAVAVEVCRKRVEDMMQAAESTVLSALAINEGAYSSAQAAAVRDGEKLLDEYEDMLGSYLVKLSSKPLSENDAHEVNHMLHVIGDCERMGDHALNLLESSEEMRSKALRFSDAACADLTVMRNALRDIMRLTIGSYISSDIEGAQKVAPLEDVIDSLRERIRNRHIIRLQEGKCTIRLGFVLSDMLMNMERLSDHCSNIAVCQLQRHDAYNAHGYLDTVKHGAGGESEAFESEYKEYSEKYALPEA